jgi:membrane-associated phospholipid phosphatase
VAGPIVAFFMLYGLWALPSVILLPLVVWARVQVKGHTWPQTVVGALIAALATFGIFARVL